ncbi:cysteine protease family C59 [Thraustotheca clavata]|uniref:Cysteine protease family C59 n=1 Tax=Thraustotheca clavata TaxID=74557 RepID=A0A1V9ZLS4_9STRA|nr:cysteine protease family C59 [Thraustotheca clavata]
MRFSWLAFVAASALACSDFRLNTTTSEVISARTMDFNLDLKTTVEIVPRYTLIQEPVAKDCPSCPDYGWHTTYGYVGLNMLGLNVATDGLNEAGLSAAWLYLIGTKYPKPDINDARPIVTSLISYILGNYVSVAEVQAKLSSIQVAEPHAGISKLLGTDSGLSSIPLHVAVHDASAQSLVIEFLNGSMHMYNNPGGVMTNDPPLPNHLAHLANYTGSLPGGYGSNERFIRLAMLNRDATIPYIANTSYNASTSEQAAVSAAVHLIDTVTIPEAAQHRGGSTQFTVVRDHKNLKLYFKSTQNQQLRMIDLKSLDFSKMQNRKSLPVTFGNWFINITSDVLASSKHSRDMPPRSIVIAALRPTLLATQRFTATASEQSHALTFAIGTVIGMVMMGVASRVISVYRHFHYNALVAVVAGCSDFLLNADNNVISARTMDFEIDLDSMVEIVPRDTLVEELIVKGCPECPDFAWATKYGFVAFNMLGINVATDGLNEVGLSAAWLYLRGSQYPVVNTSDPRPVVTSLITYILGNFATTNEVRTGLKEIQIGEFDPALGGLFAHGARETEYPLHIAIHDATGNNLVIEFLNHTMNVYDNPNGVMTNAPPLEQHLQDLKDHGFNFDFPGDFSSSSRFVRLSILNHFAKQPYTANESYSIATSEQAGISLALHLIDSVTIPEPASVHGDATQFTVVRDHKRRKLYLTSTENQVLRTIDFAQIDFNNPDQRKSLPVTFGKWFIDITQDVLTSELRSMDMPPRSIVEAKLHGLAQEAPVHTSLNALATYGRDDRTLATFLMGAVVGLACAVFTVVGYMAMRWAPLLAALLSTAQCCSDFLLNSTTQVISGRTMDFTIDLNTLVEVIPRGTVMHQLPPKGCSNCTATTWTNKYGFVALNEFGFNVASDGLNEKGLSAGWLWLDATKYPQVNSSDSKPVITSLVSYILGTFDSVDEVRKGLKKIQNAEMDTSLLNEAAHLDSTVSFPFHVPIHDASGKSIAIEFLNSTMQIYDNPNGVITNDPPLVEQLAKLAAASPNQLPGEYDPSSRFIRLSLLNRHANRIYSANASYSLATPEQAGICAAVHLLDTVKAPIALEDGGGTEFSLIRDHKRRKLYFRSTQNQNLRVVDLETIDFSNSFNRKALPVFYGNWYEDVTKELLKSSIRSQDIISEENVKKMLSSPVDSELPKLQVDSSESYLHVVVALLLGIVMGGAFMAATIFLCQRQHHYHGYKSIA